MREDVRVTDLGRAVSAPGGTPCASAATSASQNFSGAPWPRRCNREIRLGRDDRSWRTVFGPFVTIIDIDFHQTNNHAWLGHATPIRIGRGVRVGSNAIIHHPPRRHHR